MNNYIVLHDTSILSCDNQEQHDREINFILESIDAYIAKNNCNMITSTYDFARDGYVDYAISNSSSELMDVIEQYDIKNGADFVREKDTDCIGIMLHGSENKKLFMEIRLLPIEIAAKFQNQIDFAETIEEMFNYHRIATDLSTRLPDVALNLKLEQTIENTWPTDKKRKSR